MKKLKKAMAAALAAMTMVSAMSMTAFATDSEYAESNLEYLGQSIILYSNGEVEEIIPIELDNIQNNEKIDPIITNDGIALKTVGGEIIANIPLNDELLALDNLSANYMYTFRVVGDNVLFRKEPNNSSEVLTHLFSGMILGSDIYGSIYRWKPAYLIDDLGYYNNAFANTLGYVWDSYIVYDPSV